MDRARRANTSIHRQAPAVTAILLFSSATAADFSSAAKGITQIVTAAESPAWAQRSEVERRLLSPLQAMRQKALREIAATKVETPAVDLSNERFVLYVPREPAEHGYRLLVFVAPWDGANLPPGWTSVLEREHTIFVSAVAAGNGADILERREPLALVAASNAMNRYPVDRERIYVGGFSGGSRVALRLAVAYPDIFRGAILNDGSDPIGTAEAPLPPAELFHAFQETTRLVYVTGEEDKEVLTHDAQSMQSMQQWCVFDLHSIPMSHVGHGVADSAALSQALHALATRASRDPNRLTLCRERVDRDLTVELKRVESSLAEKRPERATRLLRELDARFGGLAAPKSLELAGEISSARQSSP